MTKSNRRWFVALGVSFALLWAALAIAPWDRPTWALENLLNVVFCVLLVTTRRHFPFSRASYALWFVFLCLHTIGAHFTYAEVPYDEFFTRWTGWSPDRTFGWERNNYDRVVHFGYGLFLAYPAREIFLRVGNERGFWGYFQPWVFMVAASSIFELFEWGAALLFGGALGMNYLGTQGDEWDAQKDVCLAAVGALIAMGVTALLNARLQRDFAREWSDSLRVKRREPLEAGGWRLEAGGWRSN
jgi:putative membrane protein